MSSVTSPFKSIAVAHSRNATSRFLKAKNTFADTLQGVAASAKYLATISDGTRIMVYPVSVTHPDPEASTAPVGIALSGHSESPLYLAFAPGNPDQLISTGKDNKVILWEITDPKATSLIPKLSVSLTAPTTAAWHPNVPGLVAISHREGVSFVDVSGTTGQVLGDFKLSTSLGKDVIYATWNTDGSKFAALSKDGTLYTFDPRSYLNSSSSCALESFATPIDDVKQPSFLAFAGNGPSEQVLVLGLGRMRKPLYRYFSLSPNTSSSTKGGYTSTVSSAGDLPFSPGNLVASYDPDTQLLFVCIKSSSQLIVFETTCTIKAGKPTGSLTQFTTTTLTSGTKGFGLVPRNDMAPMQFEVERLVSLTGETLEVYRGCVTRRLDIFHPDLFPDARQVGYTNTLDAYTNGKDVLPPRVSLNPEVTSTSVLTSTSPSPSSSSSLSATESKQSPSPTPSPSASPSPTASPNPLSIHVTPATTTSTSSSSPSPTARSSPTNASPSSSGSFPAVHGRSASSSLSYTPSEATLALANKLTRTIHLHTTGKEPLTTSENTCITGITLPPTLPPFGRALAINNKYWAIPLGFGAAPSFYIRHIETFGRIPSAPITTPDTSTILGLALSDLTPQLIAVGNEEGRVRVMSIPDSSTWKVGDELKAPLQTLLEVQTGGRLHYLGFHPYIAGLLVISSFNSQTGDEISFLDVSDLATSSSSSSPSSSSSSSTISLDDPRRRVIVDSNHLTNRVMDIDFSPGQHTMTVVTKDFKVFLFSIPSGAPLLSFSPKQKTRELHTRFIDNNHLATIGFENGNLRSVSLYRLFDTTTDSPEGTKQPSEYTPVNLKTIHLPNSTPMQPFIDITSGLLYVSNVGSANVHLVHCTPREEPYLDLLSTWVSRTDIVSVNFLPKSSVDVKEVEVSRMYKVSQNGIIWPVSFRVPRKRKEFFQDDIYSGGAPSADASKYTTAKAFLNGEVEAKSADPVSLAWRNTGVALPIESLQPAGMTMLKDAPPEDLNERQKAYLAKKEDANKEKPVSFLGHKTAEESRQYFRDQAAKYGTSSGRWSAASSTQTTNQDDDDDW